MRVFVIGATGFIGGTVARRMVADGHNVKGLYRSGSAESGLSEMGITPVKGDLTVLESIVAPAQSSDATL
jgi:uncharacterized protein YbjT (DUF2867 family)